jgi:hypothetical protein
LQREIERKTNHTVLSWTRSVLLLLQS